MMKRRIYDSPESCALSDCTGRPSSWNSSFVVVLRGHEELWQRYLEAERALDEARRAVLAAATEEPMSPEEQVLHDRAEALHSTLDIDSIEWMRRHDEIEAAAMKLAESDVGAPMPAEGASS
jgi:hypothetical protein